MASPPAPHPLTGACETVYTADESIVRPREASLTLADCAALVCPEGPVRVTFNTQTRLKQGGTFARQPGFQLLFRRLLGRLSALARFHDKSPLDVDFRGLFGQWTHVGSGTTFGLGRYVIESVAAGDRAPEARG